MSFLTEMDLWANLGGNLHGCLCGDLQVAPTQQLDFLDISKEPSSPHGKLDHACQQFPLGIH